MEAKISSLLQKCRASGIYFIATAQSANRISPTIKVNMSSRILLRVCSELDSLYAIDEKGGETLISRGDMLYKTVSMLASKRAAVPYVSNDEIFNLVEEIANACK